MRKKFNKMKITLLGAITLLLFTAIIAVTGITMYSTYTSDKEVKNVTEYCKEKNGYLKVSTSNNWVINVKVSLKNTAEKLLNMAGSQSTVKNASCNPTGTSYIKTPSGDTMLPTSDFEVQ